MVWVPWSEVVALARAWEVEPSLALLWNDYPKGRITTHYDYEKHLFEVKTDSAIRAAIRLASDPSPPPPEPPTEKEAKLIQALQERDEELRQTRLELKKTKEELHQTRTRLQTQQDELQKTIWRLHRTEMSLNQMCQERQWKATGWTSNHNRKGYRQRQAFEKVTEEDLEYQ